MVYINLRNLFDILLSSKPERFWTTNLWKPPCQDSKAAPQVVPDVQDTVTLRNDTLSWKDALLSRSWLTMESWLVRCNLTWDVSSSKERIARWISRSCQADWANTRSTVCVKNKQIIVKKEIKPLCQYLYIIIYLYKLYILKNKIIDLNILKLLIYLK